MKTKILLSALLFNVFILYSQNYPKTGLLFNDNAYKSTPLKARNVAFQDVVADNVKASLKQYVPKVRTQGQYGTCVGWSSAYYGRTILNARLNKLNSKTEISKQTYSPVFTYLNSNVDNDYNCQGGAYINKALKTMVEKGVPFFKDYNVMCDSYIPSNIWSKAAKNKIKDFNRLFASNESYNVKVETIKRSLINGNPVIIGFGIENGFYTAKNVYEPASYTTNSGHAMCVIGYDDNKYGGAFEIVNSWGNRWGNNGFIWVRYKDFVKFTRYAYEMIPNRVKRNVTKELAGELRLKLSNGTTVNIKRGSGKFEKTILGWQDVVIEEEKQSIGDYQTTKTHKEKTRYRVYAKVNKPAYVYVLGADSNGRNGVLFPHKKDISAYIAYKNTEVIIPGEKYWFRLNADVASDYTIVLFSEKQIDIQKAKRKLDEMKGKLLDKLYVIFKDELINKNKITLNNSKMAFNAKYTKGSMALMVLDIKRR